MPNNTNRVHNRLINEKSPYLLQHAYNPVDWYPWCDEAFAEAKKKDIPVFLSIGYSSCHWCHVMERESFEDKEVAEILNKNFISIKVDREERSDIDNFYMEACMAMTGSGGWPLNLFLTPDNRRPFFAGTYFPKEDKWGMTGLVSLLEKVSFLWQNERDKLYKSADSIYEYLKRVEDTAIKNPEPAMVDLAYDGLKESFDNINGGFSSAPKFPTVGNLLFLMRYYTLNNNVEALDIIEKTLYAIADGGICDHVGGGFFRYSTDSKWLVPHFEKMLYDNALLLMIYAEAALVIDEKYRYIAERIVEYLDREMLAEEGAYYTAQDADSEGVEGKYYLWTPAEVKAILGDKEGDKFNKDYDITEEGNFEGKNIPNRIGKGFIYNDQRLLKLHGERIKRVSPFKDDKILASSNGLMIAALAEAGRILDKPDWVEKAERAARFCLDKLFIEGRLMSRYREQEAKQHATLDDHAYLLWGILEIYYATFKPNWLNEAVKLSNKILFLFSGSQGGLYLSGNDIDDLPIRQKSYRDSVLPSGNSIVASCFTRISLITDNKGLEEAADNIIKAIWSDIEKVPIVYLGLLSAYLFRENNVNIIIRRGEGLEQMLDLIKGYHPFINYVLCGDGYDEINELIPFYEEKLAKDGKATAYICDNTGCKAPVNDIDQLKNLLINK